MAAAVYTTARCLNTTSSSAAAAAAAGVIRVVAANSTSIRGFRSAPGQYGPGTRTSVSGKKIAVFGASGRLGRAIMQNLGKVGTLGVAPNRDSDYAVRFMRPMFDLGMLHTPFYSFEDEDSVREAIAGCDAVVNCVGKHYETKHLMWTRRATGGFSNINCPFETVHVDIPRLLARLCKEEGIPQLVHVSALAANLDSESRFNSSKAEGELAVHDEYPEATIVRPARMFGHEDRFLVWFATMAKQKGFVPLVEGGKGLIQPVSVYQVADAISTMVDNPDQVNVAGKVCEFAGPEEWSWKETSDLVYDIINHPRNEWDMSRLQAEIFGTIMQQLANPWFTRDEAIQMTEDVMLDPTSSSVKLEDFDITPQPLSDTAFTILQRFRPGGQFIEVKGYHT